jgi:hypothetical protein
VEASGLTRARRDGLAGVTRLARRVATRTRWPRTPVFGWASVLQEVARATLPGMRPMAGWLIVASFDRLAQLRRGCSPWRRPGSQHAEACRRPGPRPSQPISDTPCRRGVPHSRSTSRSSGGSVARAQRARHGPVRPEAESPCSRVRDSDRSPRSVFRRIRCRTRRSVRPVLSHESQSERRNAPCCHASMTRPH